MLVEEGTGQVPLPAVGLGPSPQLGAAVQRAAKTLHNLEWFEVTEMRGRIEKGKVADLVLYDGDPFEHATHVTHTVIDGRKVYDRAEYLKLPFERRALPLLTGGSGIAMGLPANFGIRKGGDAAPVVMTVRPSSNGSPRSNCPTASVLMGRFGKICVWAALRYHGPIVCAPRPLVRR